MSGSGEFATNVSVGSMLPSFTNGEGCRETRSRAGRPNRETWAPEDLEINAAVLSSRRKVPVKSKAGMRSVDLKGLLDFEPDRYRDRERARSALRAERMTEM